MVGCPSRRKHAFRGRAWRQIPSQQQLRRLACCSQAPGRCYPGSLGPALPWEPRAGSSTTGSAHILLLRAVAGGFRRTQQSIRLTRNAPTLAADRSQTRHTRPRKAARQFPSPALHCKGCSRPFPAGREGARSLCDVNKAKPAPRAKVTWERQVLGRSSLKPHPAVQLNWLTPPCSGSPAPAPGVQATQVPRGVRDAP